MCSDACLKLGFTPSESAAGACRSHAASTLSEPENDGLIPSYQASRRAAPSALRPRKSGDKFPQCSGDVRIDDVVAVVCRAVVIKKRQQKSDYLGIALCNRVTRGPSSFSPLQLDIYLCPLYSPIFFTNKLITDRARVNSSMGYRLAYVNTPVFTLCRPRELRVNLVVGAVSPNHQ